MKNHEKPMVVITEISPLWHYFQHFLLGFYDLEEGGFINFKIRAGCWFRFFSLIPGESLSRFLHLFYRRFVLRFSPSLRSNKYTLKGYVVYRDKKRNFCIDCADSPYVFDGDELAKTNAYFKMQCPREIDPDQGFELAPGVYAPYCDYRDTRTPACPNLASNLSKIHPLIIGFRCLSQSMSPKGLRLGFANYVKGGEIEAVKVAMCYFGNSRGPEPSSLSPGQRPDWNSERDLMGYFGEKVSHPNEKRSIVSEILNGKGELFDGRIIRDGSADGEAVRRHTDLVIPIERFCDHITRFQYNINVSGYRTSIPNRFMESFIVGTAILTDKLHVKWYLPFNDGEVVETVEMSYAPIDKVDWNQFNRDLEALPKVSKKTVLEAFWRKWAPAPVAKYIVNTTLGGKVFPDAHMD